MDDLEYYTKKLNELENNIKDKKQLFHHILKLSYELKAEFNFAKFEGDEKKIKQINNYLSILLLDNESVTSFASLYNEINQKQKEEFCKYFYEYSSIFDNREQDILILKERYDFKDYVKLTFISLFYL